MSLLQIAKVPTAENSAIHLNEADNIAVARVPLAQGNEVRVDGIDIGVRDSIPAGHKVALKSIPTGANIIRYGQVIGRARIPIEPGQHVHTHNVAFDELTFDYEFPVGERKLENTARNVPTFLGYAREDGRAGTRNYIAVVAASNCAAHTAEQIAASFGPNELPRGSRRRRRVPSRRRMRARDRSRHGSTAPNTRRRAGSSERGRSDHSRLGMRSEPDRALPRPRCAKLRPAGRHDGPGIRRHAGDG